MSPAETLLKLSTQIHLGLRKGLEAKELKELRTEALLLVDQLKGTRFSHYFQTTVPHLQGWAVPTWHFDLYFWRPGNEPTEHATSARFYADRVEVVKSKLNGYPSETWQLKTGQEDFQLLIEEPLLINMARSIPNCSQAGFVLLEAQAEAVEAQAATMGLLVSSTPASKAGKYRRVVCWGTPPEIQAAVTAIQVPQPK